MALSQMARLGLDAQPYYQGLAGVENRTESTFEKVSRKGSKHLLEGFLRTFTPAGILTAVGTGAVALGMRGYNQAKEIQAGAIQAGLSVEDYRAAKEAIARLGDASNLTKEEFVKLVDQIRKEKPGVSQEQIIERARIGDMVKARWERLLDQMTSGLFLVGDAIEKALYGMVHAMAKGTDMILHIFGVRQDLITKWIEGNRKVELAREAAELALYRRAFTPLSTTRSRAELLARMAGIQEPMVTETPKAKPSTASLAVITDSLARIGGYIGRPQLSTIQKDQLYELKHISYGVDRMNQTLSDGL